MQLNVEYVIRNSWIDLWMRFLSTNLSTSYMQHIQKPQSVYFITFRSPLSPAHPTRGLFSDFFHIHQQQNRRVCAKIHSLSTSRVHHLYHQAKIGTSMEERWRGISITPKIASDRRHRMERRWLIAVKTPGRATHLAIRGAKVFSALNVHKPVPLSNLFGFRHIRNSPVTV